MGFKKILAKARRKVSFVHKQHAMKQYRRHEGKLHAFQTSASLPGLFTQEKYTQISSG
jgi:hypothetical protein